MVITSPFESVVAGQKVMVISRGVRVKAVPGAMVIVASVTQHDPVIVMEGVMVRAEEDLVTSERV